MFLIKQKKTTDMLIINTMLICFTQASLTSSVIACPVGKVRLMELFIQIYVINRMNLGNELALKPQCALVP